MDRSLRLKLDIQKVVNAIDDEVDAYLVSRQHKSKEIREIAEKSFNKKVKRVIRLSKKMTKKYG